MMKNFFNTIFKLLKKIFFFILKLAAFILFAAIVINAEGASAVIIGLGLILFFVLYVILQLGMAEKNVEEEKKKEIRTRWIKPS